MKIACIGKGGSGKTTVCALLARAAAANKRGVVAYDADVNQHLGVSLGLPADSLLKMRLIGHEQQPIKEYLRGTNPRIVSVEHMVKTTPPGQGSNMLPVRGSNKVYDDFSILHDGVRLMRVGPMDETDFGLHCFHGKSGIIELLLSHTIDNPEDRVLVDVTAGTDSLASGLAAKVHGLVLVIEPTVHSISVYKQIIGLSGRDTHVLMVANKVEDDEDLDFIRESTGQNPVAVIPNSKAIRHIGRGQQIAWEDFESELQDAVMGLDNAISSLPFDWESYMQKGHEIHRLNCDDWINERYGIEGQGQIDPDFSYQKV